MSKVGFYELFLKKNPLPKWKKGRKCEICGKSLNIYNKHNECLTHSFTKRSQYEK